VAVEFYIPKMSDHMEEAVFVEWLVADGDAVEKGQPILVIDTDKVVAEVEAPASGLLTGIRPGLDDGVTIAVGVTVAFIVDDLTDEVPVLQPLDGGSASSPQTETPDAGERTPPVSVPTTKASSGGPVRATPAGRKAARELGVDLAGVPGSGPGGRISESDVRTYASSVSQPLSDAHDETDGDEWLELTLAQSVTARRMVESLTSVPQFSLVTHLDMTAVLALRERLGSDGTQRPSVTAYLVKAVASALVDHQRVNGFYREGRIQVNKDINVGVAWGTNEGLFVPVIHGADRLSVAAIADHLTRLRALADGRGFAPADLDGGTFTLSNLGMYEIDEFRALINPPQSAILATGRVSKAVVVDSDGAIRFRDRITATLTADHRSLDGVAAALFLSSVSTLLREPDRLDGRSR
jgi:pyruvate dehydrogenase E2 component (dihydrolipoyllysine-residue acetyltransferase)